MHSDFIIKTNWLILLWEVMAKSFIHSTNECTFHTYSGILQLHVSAPFTLSSGALHRNV